MPLQQRKLEAAADIGFISVYVLVSPEVRCPPITTLKNISLSPPACGKTTASPGSTCLLTCRKGFTLLGNRKAVCLGSGNWTANIHKAICAGMNLLVAHVHYVYTVELPCSL